MNVKVYSILGISVIILFLLLPFPKGFLYDVDCFALWTVYIKEFGAHMAYENRVDYPPTMVYLLSVIGSFYNNPADILVDYKTLKLITFVFSAINGYLIYLIANKLSLNKGKSQYVKVIAFLYVLNPGIIFNVLFWGQIEEIAVFLLLVSIYSMIGKNFNLMFVSLLLMINLKVLTIILIPFFIVYAIFNLAQLNKNKKMSLILLIFFIIPIFYSPFILNHTFYKLRSTISAVDSIPVLSANAYNFWFLLFDNPYISDKIIGFNMISLKDIGKYIFLTISGFFCIADVFFRFVKRKNNVLNLGSWFLLMAITILLFFFFHTQMHERYGHVSIALLAIALAIYNTKELLFVYLIISLAYCLNVVDVFLKYNNEFCINLNINPKYISIFFLAGIIMGVIFYVKIIITEKMIEN